MHNSLSCIVCLLVARNTQKNKLRFGCAAVGNEPNPVVPPGSCRFGRILGCSCFIEQVDATTGCSATLAVLRARASASSGQHTQRGICPESANWMSTMQHEGQFEGCALGVCKTVVAILVSVPTAFDHVKCQDVTNVAKCPIRIRCLTLRHVLTAR